MTFAPDVRIPSWAARHARTVLIIGLALHVIALAIWFRGYATQVDLQIYRFGGRLLLAGTPLYDHGLAGAHDDGLFNYPPFAAVLFLPLTPFPVAALQVLVPIGNVLLLLATVNRLWRGLNNTLPPWQRRALTLLSTGGLLWLEPVRTTIALGQINLVLLALVVFDLLPTRKSRWPGIGIGLAAAIKLTPLLFIPFLLVTGRIRAAVTATATFLATVALGFLIRPSDAVNYWFGGLGDTSRITHGGVAAPGNASFRGLLTRLGLTAPTLWLFGAGLLTIACLLVAALAQRRGQSVLAIALCGMGTTVASPYSWPYHWVWFVPLAIFLAYQAFCARNRLAAGALAALCLLTAAWPVTFPGPTSGLAPQAGLIALRPGGWGEQLATNLYLLVFGSALVATVFWLRRAVIGTAMTATNPELRSCQDRDHAAR